MQSKTDFESCQTVRYIILVTVFNNHWIDSLSHSCFDTLIPLQTHAGYQLYDSFYFEDLFLVPEIKWYFELYTTHDTGKQRILIKN